MKKQTWVAALCAAMMALPFAGCDNGSSEPEEPGIVYKDGWLLAGSTVRQYRGAETSVTTPEGVTRIGEHAFENCTGITEVTIRDGVTVIDDYAFYGCTSLAAVTVPASVALIGSGAFSGCALETVRYGGTVGQWCAVDGIGSLAWAEHVSVGGIEDLNGTAALEIPDGTKTIAAGAFYYCESLTDVTVPASVTRIGGNAFREYTALKVLQFKGTTEQWRAIEGCGTVAVPYIQCSDGGVGVQEVPAYLKLYGTKVTGYADGLPEKLVIPDGVTEIGSSAFEDCKSLLSVEIPASVTSIEDGSYGSGAFSGCTNLTSVTIGDGMTSIGDYAFYNCTSLAEMTIPGSVTSIGNSAFYYCSNLADVTYNGTLTQWCAADDNVELMRYAKHVILTGEDNMDLKQAETIVIPDGATKIAKRAFLSCENLANLTIPATVTEIGEYAFSRCTKLKEVQFKGTKAQWQAIEGIDEVYITCIQCSDGYLGVKDAPDYLTMSGTKVTGYADGLPANLVIPDGVTGITYNAFKDCTILESVDIPGSVTSIEGGYSYGAFDGCTNLKTVKIGDGVAGIGDYAFYGCTSLASVTIPDSVKTIGMDAFSGCTSLASVTIPDGVKTIGEYAFYNCTSLASVTIPDGVKTIGKYAFYNCTNLAEVTIPATVTEIGGSAFEGCTSLASVKIPDGVETIAKRAFLNCENLANLTIPASVTEIGESAFSSKLKEVQFKGTKAQWQAIKGSNEVNITYIQCSDGYLGVKDAPDYLKLYGTKVTGYTDGLPANLVIPKGVTDIGNNAFSNCTSLASVTIPASVTEIGKYAFFRCTSLTSVTIPASVKKIESGGLTSAFSQCDKLDTVTYQGTLAQWCALNGNGSLMSYAKRVIMSDGTDLKTMTDLAIPNGVESIGRGAFRNCAILTSVTISDNVKTIGEYAFSQCSSLTSVTIPASVTEIGTYAFDRCTSLTSVTYLGTEEQWNSIEGIADSGLSGKTITFAP